MRPIYFLIVFLIFSVDAVAHPLSSFGSPFIQNYHKAQYKAGNQNWAIAQGKDGLIYTANNEGLLIYDGATWDLHYLSNKKSLRSVAIAANGDIYIGGKEEFGFFQRKNGKLVYNRLSDQVKPNLLENDEIWKIITLKDAVIFQAFSKIYIYKDSKIEIKYGDGEPFLFAHQLQNSLWIEKIPSGLQRLSLNSIEPISSQISNVMTILPYKGNNYLLGTAKDGLYTMNDKGELQQWNVNPQINVILKETQINNGVQITESIYAFGTIKNGIFIIDATGKLLQHLHKRNGLQNNTVLSMALDQQGNIWAGLDNGIDRIEINAPFYYYKDIFGEIGTVYAIKIFKGNIYVGTNQGLFSTTWQAQANNNFDLKFIPGTQGQVWSLEIMNDRLICGHNDGTFIVDGNKVRKISDWTGGWANKQHSPNMFIQGNYTGIASFQFINQDWAFNYKLPLLKEAVLDLLVKEENQYWVVLNKSILLVEFTPDFRTIKVLQTFRFAKDFPNIQRLKPIRIEGNTMFITDQGIFLYDNVLSKFNAYTELNTSLGSFARANYVKTVGKNKYIMAREGKFAQVYFDNFKIQVDSSSFNSLGNFVMKNYENAEPYQDNLFFGLDNGIAVFSQNNYKKSPITKPLIKGYRFLNYPADSLYYLGPNTQIPSNNNNIRIHFISPWYVSTALKYQYLLEGHTNEWSALSETPYVDLTNLEWGSYTFKVRAMSDNGQYSDITSISFKVQAPWYLTWQALLVYLVLISIGYYSVRRVVIAKIARDKQRMRLEFQHQQEEVLRKEVEENEKKLMALKNEQLSQELELKNRKLANAATNIIYKNELFDNLHQELLNLKDKNGKALSNEQLQKINKLINNAKSDDRDWDLFEKSFNESHENFFKKLKVNYPTLSPNDLKLCAYLRLNMTSKDIASLINISIRGVEIRRYRLRKKFNLATDKNLNEFLMEL